MKKIFLLFGMFLFISVFSISKISDKVFPFPAETSFSEQESAIVGVSHFLTLLEIDNIKFKVTGDRVQLAPGYHSFKIKKKGCMICSGKTLSINIVADKFYILRTYDTKIDSRTYETTYEIVETTDEFLKDYGKKKK